MPCDSCYKRTMTPKDIKRLRERLGMTQEQFAERLGVARETVARWEIGANAPRGLSLKALKELAAKARKAGS